MIHLYWIGNKEIDHRQTFGSSARLPSFPKKYVPIQYMGEVKQRLSNSLYGRQVFLQTNKVEYTEI